MDEAALQRPSSHSNWSIQEITGRTNNNIKQQLSSAKYMIVWPFVPPSPLLSPPMFGQLGAWIITFVSTISPSRLKTSTISFYSNIRIETELLLMVVKANCSVGEGWHLITVCVCVCVHACVGQHAPFGRQTCACLQVICALRMTAWWASTDGQFNDRQYGSSSSSSNHRLIIHPTKQPE